MKSQLKTVRVFVSSTFRDMHAERDYLNRFVFPELRSRCAKRRVEFVGIDLRWGITEEESKQRRALAICLDEIKRCNFFVSLLGDRYGWKPPPEEIPQESFESARQNKDISPEDASLLDEWYQLDKTSEIPVYRMRDGNVPNEISEKLIYFWEVAGLQHAGESITAQEIYHAVFDPHHRDSHAFFYFRRSGVHQHPEFPEPFVPIFVEKNPENVNKLAQLKQQIQNRIAEKILEYEIGYAGLRIDPAFLPPDLKDKEREVLKDGVIQPEEWHFLSDGVRNAVEAYGTVAMNGMENLGDQILKDLWIAIEASLKSPAEPLDAYSQERAFHERFIEERTRIFIGREDSLETMLWYASNKEDRQLLVITGSPGCGKSALMAKCARLCSEKFPDALVLPHFIGASPGSTDLLATIRSLCETLRRECNIEEELSMDSHRLREQLRIFMEKAGSAQSIIILIDAVNQLDPVNRSHELSWLPSLLPPGVRLIVSTLAGVCLDRLRKRVPCDHVLEISPLSQIDQKSLIQAHLARRGKKLTERQILHLIDTTVRPDADLPLYILVALEELCLFGDYDALNRRIDSLPRTLPYLFDQVLARLEMDHTHRLVEFILRLVAVSRSGLLESEILDLLTKDKENFPSIYWTQLYRSLEFYLRPLDETTGAGLIYFYHDQLRFAIYRRYLYMESPYADPTGVYRQCHNLLADYFRELATEKNKPSKWKIENLRSLKELPYHLHGARRKKELRNILFDFNWLQTKLEAFDVLALVTDFSLVPEDSDACLVQGSIQLSANALALDKEQLAGQLLGRLQFSKEYQIQLMLKKALKSKVGKWLHPLKPSLTPPGGPLLRSMEGHSWTVSDVVITRDGKRVISTSDDNTLKIWDMESGEDLRTLKGHNFVNKVLVTPDGLLAISAGDETLRVWNIETGELLHTLEGHTDSVYSIASTIDGHRIISASGDKTLKLWDPKTGEQLRTMEGHKDFVTSVLVMPDGIRAVSGSTDGTLKVWNIETGEELKTLKGQSRPEDALAPYPADTPYNRWTKAGQNSITALAVSPDGRHVISASNDSTLKVWDINNGQELNSLKSHIEKIRSVAITPDGKRVISASSDNTLKVWDINSGKEIYTLKGHISWISSVVVVPDGRLVVSASADNTLRVWDIYNGKVLKTLEGHTEPVVTVAVTPDSRRVISGSIDNTLKVWDIESRDELHSAERHTHSVTVIMVTPDGSRIITGSMDATLKVWDIKTGDLFLTLEGHTRGVLAAAIMPDGKHVISSSDDRTLKIWDLENGEEVFTLAGHTGFINAIAVTPDGCRVISASQDNTLKVWDVVSRKEIFTLEGHTDGVDSVILTPNGRRAVSASPDYTLKVWNIENGTELRTLEGHTKDVRAVAVTLDGQHIISASFDETLKVWDLESGEMLLTLTHNKWAYGPDYGWVMNVVITPDGKRFISASDEKTLSVWDLESGEELLALKGHTRWINSFVVTPDGRRVISASLDRTLKVWDIESGKIISSFNGDSPLLTCAVSPDGKTIITGEASGRMHFLRLEGAS